MRLHLFVLALLCAATSATYAGPTLSIGYGNASGDSEAYRLALRAPAPANWTADWPTGLDLFFEAGATGVYAQTVYGSARDSQGRASSGGDSLHLLSIAPVLRLTAQVNGRFEPYVEFGVGGAYLDKKQYDDSNFYLREMGAHWAFENRIGVGVTGKQWPWTLGVQFLHFSNGDLATENDGLDASMLVFGVGL